MSELSSPRAGDIIKPSDVVGHLLIVRPIEFLPDFPTSNGNRDAVRVDVADLNANTDSGDWGITYRDALWFGRVLVSGLRRQMGEMVLGWMAQGIGKPGQNPPFQLTDAMGNTEAVRAAQQWLNAHPEFENTAQTVAPQSGPPAPLPLPGQAQAQVPLGTNGVLGNTGHGVPAAPVQQAPQPAVAAPLPVPGNGAPQPVNTVATQLPNGQTALQGLDDNQKAALKALGFPVG